MWRCRFDTPGKLTPAHSAGATHSPPAVGALALCAGVNFPTGINLAQCSPPHTTETSALVTKPLV